MSRVLGITGQVLRGCVSFVVAAALLGILMLIVASAWGGAPMLVALAALVFCGWSFWHDWTPRGAILFGVPALVACGGLALSVPYALGRLSECGWGTANTITSSAQALDHALRVTASRRETLEASGFASADDFVAGLRNKNCCHVNLDYDLPLLRWQWTVTVTSRGWETIQTFNRCGLKVQEFRMPS